LRGLWEKAERGEEGRKDQERERERTHRIDQTQRHPVFRALACSIQELHKIAASANYPEYFEKASKVQWEGQSGTEESVLTSAFARISHPVASERDFCGK